MAAPGDQYDAFDNPQHKLDSNAEKLHQSSHSVVNSIFPDISDKNTAGQGPMQDDTIASSTTTAALRLGDGSSELPPSTSSSSSLPPGLATSFRGRGRGRGARSYEVPPAAAVDGIGWQSRPPPASSNFRGGGRGRGGGGGTSIRGGYHSGSPTSSQFVSGRRGGRHGSYHDTTIPNAYQKQAFKTYYNNNNANNNLDDAPPPGFSSSDTEECPPPGYNLSDSSEDDGPPPGFEEEDGPPPGFEKNKADIGRDILTRGGSSGSGSGVGRGNVYISTPFNRSNVDVSFGSSRGGGRGGHQPRGGIAIGPPRIYSPAERSGSGGEHGGIKKVLEVPRNRPTSASSSYTSSMGHGHIFHISQSPIPQAATRTGEAFSQGGERFPPLKTANDEPIFPDFTSPSSHFSSFSPNFVDETSSALQQIALGGVTSMSATSSGGGGGVGTMVSTPEQSAPLIPPMPSTLQITPLYPQIGIKSIW